MQEKKGEEVRGLTERVESSTFDTLKMLNQGHSISDICKYRKVSRQAVYKKLALLITKGLVSKSGYGVYELTDKGVQGLHSLVTLRYKLRQHNLAIKFSVLDSPKNWSLKRQELRSLPYFNHRVVLNNNYQDLFSFGRLWIKTTSKSVIIKIPSIYANDWEGALLQTFSILEDCLPKVEHLFKVRLVKDFKSNIKIISNEYASIQDALAKLYHSEGSRLYLTGDDGKIWLITDLSFSTDELEYIHPDRACDDVDSIAPFLNDLRKNPITLSSIREETKNVLLVAQASMQNEVKHQRVLDEILLAFNKINIRLDKAGL